MNGCCLRSTRHPTMKGASNHAALAITTTAGCGLAWTPPSSSNRMMNTLVNMMDAQMTLGMRIQSRPRAKAYRAAA